jgi:hypothetical protein
MVDTVATPMTYQGGPVSPLLIQSQQTDPRVALMRQLAESNANNQTPILNPMSALARVIAGVAPAIGQLQLGSEAADRQKAFGETMSKALEAGQGGGFDALAKVLSASDDPAAKQMALQYGIQNLSTKQAMEAKLAEIMMGKGAMRDPATGAAVEIPNYGNVVGGVKQAESAGEAQGKANVDLTMQPKIITATTPAKAAAAGAEAGAKSAAELPFAGPKAGAEAAARAPYEVVPVHGVGAFPKMTVLGTGPQPAAQSTPPAVLSKQGYDALPKGTPYRAPDGQIRVKQ